MTNEGRAAVRQAPPTLGLRNALAAGALALALAACGGGPGDAGDGADGAGEDGSSFPAGFGVTGGGGTLIFDGEEIEIASAVCVLEADTFDVGTVSDNGFRVFVSQNNPQNAVSVQILDPDSLQWFPEGNGDEATRNGSTFTSDEMSYFNNSDDRTITASFTIECP